MLVLYLQYIYYSGGRVYTVKAYYILYVILSPIIFTIYTADMELWLKTSKLFNFADDTTTDSKGKSKQEIQSKLEEEANNILDFMASNGLVANQGKTEFLLLNEKKKDIFPLNELKVGETLVKRTDHTKLLSVIIEDTQEWNYHQKSLKTSLNQRLFVIRRVSRQIPRDKIMSIVHALWISKLRYGLQLCSKVQLTIEETKSMAMKTLQLAQNRLLRLLNNSRVKDRVSVATMLEKFNLPSVNQLAAEIKLIEVWKSLNTENSPIRLEPYNANSNPVQQLRTKSNRIFDDSANLKASRSSFNVDAARIWNMAPDRVRSAKSLAEAKRIIKLHTKSLPI